MANMMGYCVAPFYPPGHDGKGDWTSGSGNQNGSESDSHAQFSADYAGQSVQRSRLRAWHLYLQP